MDSFQTPNAFSGRMFFTALTGLALLLGGCSSSSSGGDPDPIPDPDDTTPADFSFTEQTGVALDTLIESNAITVGDIDAETDIGIDEHGEYAVDGGDFTDSDDTVTEGQEVVVRVRSPDMPGATAETTLTIGGVSATFSVTTQNDPTGYYTGSAEVMEEDNEEPLMLGDDETVRGLLTDERFLIFSTYEVSAGTDRSLTYEATNIELTGTDYTADLTIYDNGEVLHEQAVEGTVTEGSGLTMTMDGEGAGNGTIELTYAQSNSEAADLSRIANNSENEVWVGDLNEVTNDYGFSVTPDGDIEFFAEVTGTVFDFCVIDGSVAVIDTTALYSADVTFTDCGGDGDANGDYTGLITVDIEDNTLVVIFSDGTLAGAGVYERRDLE